MSAFIPSPNEDNKCCDEPCEQDNPCDPCCPCDGLPLKITVFPYTKFDRGTSDPNGYFRSDCNDEIYKVSSGTTYQDGKDGNCCFGGICYNEDTEEWSGISGNQPSSGCNGLFGIWLDDDGYPTNYVVRGEQSSASRTQGPYNSDTSGCGDQDCYDDCYPPLASGERACSDNEVPCSDDGGCGSGVTECIDGVDFCTGDQPCCPSGTPLVGVHNCCECPDGAPACDDLSYPCCGSGIPDCSGDQPCCEYGEPICGDYSYPCCDSGVLPCQYNQPCCGDSNLPLCSSIPSNACGSGIIFDPYNPCVPCCNETNDCLPDPCCDETNDCEADPCCDETYDCDPDPCCEETNDCPSPNCCDDSPNCYDNCCDETNDCDPDPCQDPNCCDPDDYPPQPEGCVDCVDQTCEEICEFYYIDTTI